MTNEAPRLTAAQRRAYDALREVQPVSPREFARALYPDSPGWNRVTRKFGGNTGAMGGTMPMIGARMLWKLRDLGLAYPEGSRWRAIERTAR